MSNSEKQRIEEGAMQALSLENLLRPKEKPSIKTLIEIERLTNMVAELEFSLSLLHKNQSKAMSKKRWMELNLVRYRRMITEKSVELQTQLGQGN